MTRPGWRRRVIDMLLLAVAAWSSPLQVWANNPVGVNYPHRLLLVGMVPWVMALAAVVLAERRGVRRITALFTAFVTVLLLMQGGGVTSNVGFGWGLALIGALVASTSYLIARRDNQNFVLGVLAVFSLVLAVAPVESLARASASVGTDLTESRPAPLDIDLARTPHIFVIVADGYAGQITLSEEFGLSDANWSKNLGDKGFETPSSAWTSYSATVGALPSLLDMSYPIEAGPGVQASTRRRLYEINGGDNRLVSELKENGYRFVMIESGWSGSSCGVSVDECVRSPFVDEATFVALERTVLGELLLESRGYAFGIGARHTIDWLTDQSERLSESPTPHLVYAHLMIPHPPFLVDSSCEHAYRESMSGVFFQVGASSMAEKKEAYLEQAACVLGFIEQLVDQVSEDSVVVVIGDHGTDIRDQLRRHPKTWDQADLIERMNIFLAVRAGPNCSVGDRVVMPNVMRRLLSCLGDEKIADIPPRMFKVASAHADGEPLPILEVDSSEVHLIVELPNE